MFAVSTVCITQRLRPLATHDAGPAMAAVATPGSLDGAASFLATCAPDASTNQYWYSAATIAAILSAVPPSQRTAFISCPSLFYAVPAAERAAAGHVLLDVDPRFIATPGFVAYDFAEPDAVPAALLAGFDAVVIDPPFVTPEVWRQYARTAALLLRGSRVIATTIAENEGLLRELFGPALRRAAFAPSVPLLVYQYALFTTIDDAPAFEAVNLELGDA